MGQSGLSKLVWHLELHRDPRPRSSVATCPLLNLLDDLILLALDEPPRIQQRQQQELGLPNLVWVGEPRDLNDPQSQEQEQFAAILLVLDEPHRSQQLQRELGLPKLEPATCLLNLLNTQDQDRGQFVAILLVLDEPQRIQQLQRLPKLEPATCLLNLLNTQGPDRGQFVAILLALDKPQRIRQVQLELHGPKFLHSRSCLQSGSCRTQSLEGHMEAATSRTFCG